MAFVRRAWQTAPFMEVEVAIRLLYMLGEALPASHGAHFSGDAAKTCALQDMMRTVSLVSPQVPVVRAVPHSLSSSARVLRRQQLPAPLRVPGVL